MAKVSVGGKISQQPVDESDKSEPPPQEERASWIDDKSVPRYVKQQATLMRRTVSQLNCLQGALLSYATVGTRTTLVSMGAYSSMLLKPGWGSLGLKQSSSRKYRT